LVEAIPEIWQRPDGARVAMGCTIVSNLLVDMDATTSPDEYATKFANIVFERR
jgi:hypothetical protein